MESSTRSVPIASGEQTPRVSTPSELAALSTESLLLAAGVQAVFATSRLTHDFSVTGSYARRLHDAVEAYVAQRRADGAPLDRAGVELTTMRSHEWSLPVHEWLDGHRAGLQAMLLRWCLREFLAAQPLGSSDDATPSASEAAEPRD